MTSRSPHVNRWRAFALLAVSFFMTVIDLTIVNVSLPTIGRDLHFSQTNLQWVVTAYALTFGGFLLLGGRAADLLGRRRILMLGLGLFSAASLAAALATGAGFMIGARAVQGIGAAIMLPAALSIVMNMFGEGAERNKALGIWGGLGAGGATVGVIAGGLLTRYAGWQYIFYLNVPIGAAALLLAPRIVPESWLDAVRRKFDAAGALAGTAGLVLLVDAISQASQYGWGATRTIGVLAAAAALLTLFLVVERRAEAPILPLSIFRLRTLSGANVAGPAVGWQLLRVHLCWHPVHAAGSALQRAADRRRLAGGVTDIDRARRALAVAGHAGRGEDRDGGRDDADRRRGDLGDPGARPRPLHRQPARTDGRRRRRYRVRVHPDLDRRACRREGATGRARVGAAEQLPAARRRDRDRDRLKRCRHPHPNAASRRQQRARGAHRRVSSRRSGCWARSACSPSRPSSHSCVATSSRPDQDLVGEPRSAVAASS